VGGGVRYGRRKKEWQEALCQAAIPETAGGGPAARIWEIGSTVATEEAGGMQQLRWGGTEMREGREVVGGNGGETGLVEGAIGREVAVVLVATAWSWSAMAGNFGRTAVYCGMAVGFGMHMVVRFGMHMAAGCRMVIGGRMVIGRGLLVAGNLVGEGMLVAGNLAGGQLEAGILVGLGAGNLVGLV
jgi:hypothetical protein